MSKKKLSKKDKDYILEINLWASNNIDFSKSYEHDTKIAKQIIKRNNQLISINDSKLPPALVEYNRWRKTKGLAPVKKFKYVK